MASALQGGMEGLGVNRQKARRHAQTISGGDSSNLPLGMGIADFVPFVGTTMGIEEGARDLRNAADATKRGDYIDATGEAVGAAMGLIPGGFSTYKAGKSMLKKAKAPEKQKPIETESVPKKRVSLKEWAMAGGGIPVQYEGRGHAWYKKAKEYAAGGAAEPAAEIKGSEFFEAAQAYGLGTDNETLNMIVDRVNKGESVREAAKNVAESRAEDPAYAKGGKVKQAVKEAVAGVFEGIQKILPRAEADANKAKFLAESKDQRRFYHGNQADINNFIPSRKGVFVSPDPEFASTFSEGATGRHGPNVMPVRVQVKNPFDYDNPSHMKAIREAAKKRYPGNRGIQYELDAIGGVDDSGGLHNNWASVEHPEVQRLIQQLEHDAYYTSEGGTKNLGIYNPNQIKSDIGNTGAYDVTKGDIKEAKGGEVHMSKGGKPKAKEAVKAGLKKLFGKADVAPKGVEPIIVRTPEERAVIEKFGQKQEQEAVRQKKVEKAARESAGKSPEESSKPAKSTGKRVAVPPDFYRKMAEEQGDEAVLNAARADKHLKPAGKGFIGAPRTVKGKRGLNTMRSDIDEDFKDSVDAVRLADPERLGTWYDRAKQGIAESSEPYQLPRTLEQHGVYSAGVSPESELTFALKHLNSRVAGDPRMAYRGAGMENLDEAVAEGRPANMGFKIGEYANKNDPRIPNAGLFGVNDFRRAQGMGYTDAAGNPWHEGVRDTMHPFMDAETALQVDRANAAGTGGRTDWAGPQIQEVPWVYGKAQDQYGRGKGGGRYAGDELEGIKQSLVDANNTARDYMYKHAASATHESIPGAGLNHVRQALDMTPEEKLAYGRVGRFDLPAPEAALNEFPEVGAGNRDILYGALGYRQLPSREAEGLYVNSLGDVENNPMTIARPLMDFPTGGGGLMAPDSRATMDFVEHFRPFMDAQEAGAYNLANTMNAVQGKNSMLLDTRGLSPNPLADPTAGVLPTAKQLGEINSALGEASGEAKKEANELREKLPYGPPTKSNFNKLQGLDDAASGYGVTSTNRGALVFPYNAEASSAGIKELMKRAGPAIENVFPGAKQERSLSTMGYQPGIGKRSPQGPLSTAPFSGEATADLLRHASELPQSVSENLSESEWVRNQIREKALRDAKMGGTRRDIQESRRFFSEADWPKAVAMIRKGMTPAAALAALGYNINAMAADER
jgi:hypothetical protein